MKPVVRFIKTTLIGGLLVVMPLQLAIILVALGLKKISGILTPIAVLLPAESFARDIGRNLAAALVFLGLCFVAGMMVRTAMGQGIWDWFNRRFLEKVPFFRVINRLIRQIIHTDETASFTPALIQTPMETQVLAWIVDDHPDGGYVVLIPNAPTPMVGELHVVPRDRVNSLNVSLKDYADVISGCGVGLDELLAKVPGI